MGWVRGITMEGDFFITIDDENMGTYQGKSYLRIRDGSSTVAKGTNKGTLYYI